MRLPRATVTLNGEPITDEIVKAMTASCCKNKVLGCDGQTGSHCDRCRIDASEERLAQIESNMHPTGELFKDFGEQTNKRLAALERKVYGLAENGSVCTPT